MPVEITRKGFYTSWLNGQKVNRPNHSGNHTTQDEAEETIFWHAENNGGKGVYRIQQPEVELDVNLLALGGGTPITPDVGGVGGGGGGATPDFEGDFIYPGIISPLYTNSQLTTLGHNQWPYNPFTIARPTLPSPWNSNTTNFYYVESGGSNPNEGFPGSPRGTIPDPIPAGAVVCVNGTLAQTFTNPANLTFNGTSGSPAWLMAYDPNSRPTLSNRMEVEGTYGIIDNINFLWTGDPNKLFRNYGSFMTFRHGHWEGDASSGGTFAQGDNAVWYDLDVDKARVGDAEVNERHGCKTGSNTRNQWFIDCYYHNCNGDGIQAGSNAGDTQGLIWCGGCDFSDNRQVGFWTKAGSDIIVSHCTGFDLTVTTNSSGTAFGSQYGPDWYWLLFSTARNCATGLFRNASASGGTGTNNYVIGCLSYDTGQDGTHSSANLQSTCNVGFWSPGTAIVHNTLMTHDAGIYKQTSSALEMYGNIIDTPDATNGRHIAVGNTTFTSDANVFIGTGTFTTNGTITSGVNLATWRSTTGEDANSVESALSGLNFANAAGNDFHISAGSAAEGMTAKHSAYTDFETRYGFSIYFDRDGVARGVTSAAGCYEVS